MQRSNFQRTIVIWTFLLMSSCGSSPSIDSYLNSFASFQGKEVRFSNAKLPPSVESPFTHRVVYPVGKFMLDDGAILTLVSHPDPEEPFGEIIAEMIVDQKRIDTLSIAVDWLDIQDHAQLDLPLIHVTYSNGSDENDDGFTYFTTTYKASRNGFEKQEK